MALAIRFDKLIRDGAVKDQTELARLGHVSRVRMTQIMNLNHLAPDIQEEGTASALTLLWARAIVLFSKYSISLKSQARTATHGLCIP